MYIEPKTNIKILRNVPLDNTYEHTIYFTSASAQYTYFNSLKIYELTNNTYQRIRKGISRVGINAEKLYNCNYMMFQNEAFGNKWFYAFIKNVEYINNITSEITFEIDVMQTWFFDYTLKECFVEREHTETDNLYEHYEPEMVEYGDMITALNYSGTIDWSNWTLVICTAPLGDADNPLLMNGMVSCAEYYLCENSSEDVRDFLTNVISGADQTSIISAYLFPNAFARKTSGSHLVQYGQSEPIEYDSGVIGIPETIDGYTPKNKKLFSSPYTLIEVTDSCGNSQYYKPELFSHDTNVTDGIHFNVIGKFIGNPQIICYPKYYKGETDNYNEGFLINDFPMMGVAVDTYRAWLAQQGNYAIMSGIQSGISGIYSASQGNPIGVVNSVLGLQYTINQFQVASNMPNKMITTDNSGVISSLKKKHPRFKVKTLTSMYAKQVDDFFTKYGYAIGRIKVPNTHARPEWTYVKTSGCIVNSNAPADDTKLICKIYDKGITFWKKGNNVGNYSLDNSV